MIETVVKRNGKEEAFSPEKLNGWGMFAAKTLPKGSVDWGSVVMQVVSGMGDKVTTKELQDALIKNCINRNTYEYSRMAGRLYASALPKEFYPTRKHPTLKELHEEMIKEGLIVKPNYSDEEYEEIGKLIDHRKDYTYSYAAIRQLVNKMAVQNRITGKKFETPQFIFMRVVMQAYNNYKEVDRMEHIRNMYNLISDRKINVPTPYYTNSLTQNPNTSSCCVMTSEDTAESIGVLNALGYMMTVASAGIGVHFKTRSLGDAVRGGLINHLGKVPYYRGFAQTIKSSTQQGRSGAATCFYPYFDPEIVVLLSLKNPMSTPANRVREMDYSISLNNWMVIRAAKKQPVWLFSYKDNPELYELFYSGDVEKFGEEMEKFAKEHPEKVEEINAMELLSHAVKESMETGRIYLTFIDEMNRHTPFKDKIYSSNLCIAGDQLVSSNKGLLTAKEHYEHQQELVLFDGEKKVNTSRMELIERNVPTYKITLKNGMTHTVTGYHKVKTKRGNVACQDLIIGEDEVFFNKEEGVFGDKHMPDEAFLFGLWQGDGTSHEDKYFIDVWEGKTDKLIPEIEETYKRVRDKYTNGVYEAGNGGFRAYAPVQFNKQFKVGNKEKWRLTISVLPKFVEFTKSDIPRWIREGDKETQIAYLKGLFYTDGTYSNCKSANTVLVQLTSKHFGFLDQLIALINNFGICFSNTPCRDSGGIKKLPDSNRNPKEYVCNPVRRITCGSYSAISKFEEMIGLVEFRNKELPERKEIYKQKNTSRVVSVEYVGDQDVYCVKVDSDEHLFVANGIITHNCNEISLPTKGYEKYEDLHYRVNPQKEFTRHDGSKGIMGELAFCNLAGIVVSNIKTDEEYADAAYYALSLIESGIDNSKLPFPALEQAIRYRRSAGVGIMSLAHLMAKKNKKYSTQEGKDFIHEVFETHAWHLTKASLRLAKERGVCEGMEVSKYKDGWLPIDTYNRNVDELVTVENKRDWEALRQEIIENGGIRHSTVCTEMPGESSSISMDCTNGVYGIRSLFLKKTSGDDSITWCAPDTYKLKDKYEIVWDIPSKDIIQCYAIMQKWTDQGISADLWVDRSKVLDVKLSQLIQEIIWMSKYGMKSRYYYNSKIEKEVKMDDVVNGEENQQEQQEPEQQTDEVGCSGGGCTL